MSRFLVFLVALFLGVSGYNLSTSQYEDKKIAPSIVRAKTFKKEIISISFAERPFSENTIGVNLIILASKPYAGFSRDETRYLSLAISNSIENYLRPNNSDVVLQEMEDIVNLQDGQYIIEIRNSLYIEPGLRSKNASEMYEQLEKQGRLDSDTWNMIEALNYQSPPIP